MAQWRTDELRELLERYPDLGRTEVRRLRRLYREATATEVIAINSNEELARKARRLESVDDTVIEISAILVGLGVACVLLYLMVTGFR